MLCDASDTVSLAAVAREPNRSRSVMREMQAPAARPISLFAFNDHLTAGKQAVSVVPVLLPHTHGEDAFAGLRRFHDGHNES